jgi:hypothetical protein
MPTRQNACATAVLLMRQQTGASGLARSPTVHDGVCSLELRFGLFAMDRRRTVALILGLVLCLALLGRWLVGSDNDAPPAGSPTATEPNAPFAEIVQVPRDDLKDRGTVVYEAPIGPGVFRGRVIDAATREPILEFTVELHPSRRTSLKPPPRISRSFRTEDGRFEYLGLPTGTWAILTTAAGYQRFDIPDVRLSEREPPKEILIPMRAGLAVRGRIFDEITKDGVASATISFREASVSRYDGEFQRRPSVQSRRDGSFALDGVPPGAVRLEVRADNYVIREIETFVSGKLAPVEIALSRGAIVSGYLAGIDGITPVPGEVSLINLDENNAKQISTGPAGEFSFIQLSAGRHLLDARGGGLNGKHEFTLSHNEHLEGIVLPMTAGHSIRGVVSGLRPDERTSTMILVNALGISGGMTHQADVDERGVYEVKGVAPGHVMIEAVAQRRGRLSKDIKMPANGDVTVNLEFQTSARLTGRVTRSGKPLAHTTVSVTSLSPDGGQFAQSTTTAENGEYAIENVPNGEFELIVQSYQRPGVRVAGDTVFDIDIPEAQLSGRVLEEGSKIPVVGAMIDVRRAQPRANGYRLGDLSDHFGQFAVRGLETGEFVLTVYKAGYELYRAPLSYGSPIADMTIYMRAGRGIDIKARDAENNRDVDNITIVELVNGWSGIILQLQADQNGVARIPSGFAGSSLKIAAFGYQPLEINQWNGQQLDLSLRREQ